jgi:hypothetical protein
MSTRPDHSSVEHNSVEHGQNRNGSKKSRQAKDVPETKKDVSEIKTSKIMLSKAELSKHSAEADRLENDFENDEPTKSKTTTEGKTITEGKTTPNMMTERQRAVTGLNLTSPKDLCRLRDLLAPEYNTLAARQDQLLQSARGQYVLIHEQEVRVHTDLDSAMEEAYAQYPNDLFFVARIHEQDFREYLATHGE